MSRLHQTCVFMVALTLITAMTAAPYDLKDLQKQFANPPDDARIMMRWWWFGSAVTKPEIERELKLMKDAGIGGVEVQPVYPVALDDPKQNFRNLSYLSDEFLDAVRFASDKAHQLGLRFDITLGSGWPYGGPHTPITEAAGRLRYQPAPVTQGMKSMAVPNLSNGEKLFAAYLLRGDATHFSRDGQVALSLPQADRIALPERPDGNHVVLFFIASRTGMQVKRAGIDAEGFVIDHYSRTAIDHHLSYVGDKILKALGDRPPYAIFCDSLEVYGNDWTDDLIPEFQKRRGYDLTPFLPALVADLGPETQAVRRDWGKTLAELTEARFLTPVREWAHAHKTKFRSQTYGIPPVTLSSGRLVDLPEGEGAAWDGFTTSRWASSTSHLYGRNVTSSETWTWLHSPSFRATPLDMKAEADLHFLQGINQFVGHGWPYSPPSAGNPGWRFYAAAAFNEHNPWFNVMPDIAAYLQRISFMMRQGKPAKDVAIYLPTEDARSQFKPGKPSVNQTMPALLGPSLVKIVLAAGYNFDFIDDDAITTAGISHRILILPNVERMPLKTYEKIASFVSQGGHVIALRRTPAMAPGLLEGKADTAKVAGISQTLFNSSKSNPAELLSDESRLPQALETVIKPDMAIQAKALSIGFLHRVSDDADIYFVANTTNESFTGQATFRSRFHHAEWWHPESGKATMASGKTGGEGFSTTISLAPYESRLLVLSTAGTTQMSPQGSLASARKEIDLSQGWTLKIAGINTQMARLQSWTDDERTRYFSGQAEYEKTIDLPASFNIKDGHAVLDFGPGKALPEEKTKNGMRAWYDGPVREAAVVYINDKRAGSVWHAPYELDITAHLVTGANRIRMVVSNTAINMLSGQDLPNYKLLNLRYGERFTPQDMKDLQPLDSGILGTVKLIRR